MSSIEDAIQQLETSASKLKQLSVEESRAIRDAVKEATKEAEKNGILGHGLHHPFHTMFEDVFEDLPWNLEEQSEQAIRERHIKWPE